LTGLLARITRVRRHARACAAPAPDARSLGAVTGLVYLAIIALWAVFLIPWLSRHRDEHHGRRAADRYQRAMDTLARAGDDSRPAADAGADESEDSDDAEEGDDADWSDEDDAVLMSGALPAPQQVAALLAGAVGGRGRTSSSVIRRRRRVLVLLSTAFAGSLAASVAGFVPGALPTIIAVLLAAYVSVLLRTAAKQAAGTDAALDGRLLDPHREAAQRAQRQAQALLRQRRATSPDAVNGWDAVPTTLPTYVSKPKASKVPRVVDLTAPSRRWTGEAMVQRAQEERRRANTVRAQEQFDREMAIVEPDAVDDVAELANPLDLRDSYRQPYRRAANG
jgi:hypothetical protein